MEKKIIFIGNHWTKFIREGWFFESTKDNGKIT